MRAETVMGETIKNLRKVALQMTNKLIVYYSRADENYVSGTLKMLKVGNTEVAAGIIKDLTGADIFKAEQIKPKQNP